MSKTPWILVASIVVFLGVSARAQDLTLDQILINNENALGGAEAIAKIRTLQVKTKTTIGGTNFSSTTLIKRPDCIRSEADIGGVKTITAFDGVTGWMLNTQLSVGAHKIDAMPNTATFESTIYWLAGMKAAGRTVELAGKENVKDSPAYKLNVVSKTGPAYTYYIDVRTFLPVKVVTRSTAEGTIMLLATFPGDYRKVAGIMLPHVSEARIQDETVQINPEYEINVLLEDSIFKMPAAPNSK
jgi:hypothetical protein